jgi:hypothetical protein
MEVLRILQHGPERSGSRPICGNGAVWEEIRIGIASAMPATATVTAQRLNSLLKKVALQSEEEPERFKSGLILWHLRRGWKPRPFKTKSKLDVF